MEKQNSCSKPPTQSSKTLPHCLVSRFSFWLALRPQAPRGSEPIGPPSQPWVVHIAAPHGENCPTIRGATADPMASTNLVSFSSHFWRRYWTWDSWNQLDGIFKTQSLPSGRVIFMESTICARCCLNMCLFSYPVGQSEWYKSTHVALDDLDPHLFVDHGFIIFLFACSMIILRCFVAVYWTTLNHPPSILGPKNGTPSIHRIPPRLDSAPCDVRNPHRSDWRISGDWTGDHRDQPALWIKPVHSKYKKKKQVRIYTSNLNPEQEYASLIFEVQGTFIS